MIALMLTILAANVLSETSPRDRIAYRSLGFTHDQPKVDFTKAGDSAATRITDPLAMALRVAGYPNEDGVEPDRVSIFHDGLARITIIIEKEGLHDDSIAAEETRVDLIKQGQLWEVAWAGGRWRCRRDLMRGSWWTTSLCP